MESLSEIQQAILKLSDSDCSALMKWLADLDFERWDEQLKKDIDSGKLGFLISNAKAELIQKRKSNS